MTIMIDHKVAPRCVNTPRPWIRLVGAEPMAKRTDPDVALADMRAAGIEPKGPFPGNVRTAWPGTCLTCGADVAPWLSSIRLGRGGCRQCGRRSMAASRRADSDLALQDMRAAGIEPKVPYPGSTNAPWPGNCMECGADVSPRLSSIRLGQGGCNRCGRARGDRNHSWTGDDASYIAVHKRVGALRGRPSDHACVECGGLADHWSYDGGSDRERVSDYPATLGLKYSLDLNSYSPRCVQCHKAYDRKAA